MLKKHNGDIKLNHISFSHLNNCYCKHTVLETSRVTKLIISGSIEG